MDLTDRGIWNFRHREFPELRERTRIRDTEQPEQHMQATQRTVGSRFQAGFTLLELLISITILVVLVAAAAPSIRDIAASQNATARINALNTAMLIARSEALKNQANVGIAATGGAWAQGWTVFLDANGNNAFDAGETALSGDGAAPANYKSDVVSTAGAHLNVVVFDRKGTLVGGGTANGVVCAAGYTAAKDKVYARYLNVAANGRSETHKGKGTGPTASVSC